MNYITCDRSTPLSPLLSDKNITDACIDQVIIHLRQGDISAAQKEAENIPFIDEELHVSNVILRIFMLDDKDEKGEMKKHLESSNELLKKIRETNPNKSFYRERDLEAIIKQYQNKSLTVNKQ